MPENDVSRSRRPASQTAGCAAAPPSTRFSLRVTQEMFGEKAKENPRSFVSKVHEQATAPAKQVEEFSKAKMKRLMTEERSRIAMLLRSSRTM
jgi:hypothetical protein